MFHIMMAASFQDIDKADNITINIGVGIFQGVTHSGLGSQVHHSIKCMLGKELCHCRSVGKIHVGKGKSLLRS